LSRGGAAAAGEAQREAPPWHTLPVEEVRSLLAAGPRGLEEAEARERLARHGPNALPEAPPPSPLAILLHQFQSPLIYILLLAVAVTVALGEYIDAGVIAVVLVLNAAIGCFQEHRAERSIRALMHLVAPRARVLRGGGEREIESRDLVPGDLVLLESGGRVPADLRLVHAAALLVDESLLTGESAAVRKGVEPLEGAERPLGDRTNMAYAGSIVSSGRARGYVVATGARTELGKIAEHVRGRERARTPLQERMGRFGAVVGAVVEAGCALVLGVGLLRGQPPARSS
jgi:magnesium-transporting ATPase (P-type)